jgi:uncharacterized phage protein gp47/JayE
MPMTPTGYSPVTASQSLTDIQNVFKTVFGAGFNVTPTTVNGVLIQELTNQVVAVENAKTLLYSGLYNPNVAAGVFLDSIGKLTNTNRKAATSSAVFCTITGLPGVVIPLGSQILNTNGDIFLSAAINTIPPGGTTTALFTSQVAGPIACSAGTVNRIVQQLTGWDTVTNALDGVIGKVKQTDTEYRYTRILSLATNSTGWLEAINAACQANTNISDFYVVENFSSVSQVIQGVTVAANSCCLSVYGGTDQEAAKILYDKKSGGCGMSGNTTATYVDTTFTWVSFPARFQRAVAAPIQVNVVLSSAFTYPSDIVAQIQAALVENFYGRVDNVSRVRMGVDFFVSRFYPTLSRINVNTTTSITMGLVGGPYTTSVTLPITQAPTLIAANVVVTIV